MPDADQNQLPARRQGSKGNYIIWDGDVPYPAYSPKLSKAQVSDLVGVGFSGVYEPLRSGGVCTRGLCGEPQDNCTEHGEYLPGEQRWEGMSCMEVAAFRLGQKAAGGDTEAFNIGMDRMIGKPKQVTENYNVEATIEKFLDHLPDPDAMPDYVPPANVDELMSMKADAAEAGPEDTDTVDVEVVERKMVDFI